MNKVYAPALAVSAFAVIATLFTFSAVSAKITHCVINSSHATVHVAAASGDDYSASVPASMTGAVQVICDDQTLYINESHQVQGEAIVSVAVPAATTFELSIKQDARVIFEYVSGPVVASLQGSAGLYIKAGFCPSFELTAHGNCAVVCPEARIATAVIDAVGPVNMVMGTADVILKRCVEGAAIYANNTLTTNGIREGVAPFSIAQAYAGVGIKLGPEFLFYDACATQQPYLSKADCKDYEGNPFNSDDEAVQKALAAVSGNIATEEQAVRAYQAVSKVSEELQKEREVLGALFCRRLMMCMLEKPIGPGAVSPVSLTEVKGMPNGMHEKSRELMDQMFEGALCAVTHGGCDQFGRFGRFFKEKVHALRRVQGRLNRTRSVVRQQRWAPFLAQLYKQVDAFIITGKQSW